MLVLGLNAYHGDASAALLEDGRVVAAIEEERFVRLKHWCRFPTKAVRRCLEIGGVTAAELSAVAVGRAPRAHLARKALFALTHPSSWQRIAGGGVNLRQVADLPRDLAEALGVPRERLPALHHVEHHPAHLASAFLCSPFDVAAVASIDGFGDFVSTSTATGRGARITVLDQTFFPHSLGVLYSAVTQWLGFPNYGDEFKVMGLAPYGRPTRVNDLRRLVRLLPNGRFELALEYFTHADGRVMIEDRDGMPVLRSLWAPAMERLLGPTRPREQPLEGQHEDVARSLQAVYEEVAFHVLNGLHARTRLPSLCLAGGCGMNSVANGKVRSQTPFTDLYVQPAAADNGIALGAALEVMHARLGVPRGPVLDHAYLGTAYPDADIAALLASRDLPDGHAIERLPGEEALCARVSAAIADGLVVGWYQGRMEWGARALGNRSILADPRRADMREIINTRIKFRERFRPFAPAVLEEALHDWFEGAHPDPFMQQVYPIREARRGTIPAVTHVDGSGRLQTVSARTNPRFHRLIRAFGERTGVPIILNTSFNENEPIVDTPAQALDCFLRTKMDLIVLHETLLWRRAPSPS